MQLSKSEYMMFLRHPAWLWLKKHDKSKLPEPDDNLQAIFDAGIEFEKYANQRFSDGVYISFNNYNEYLSMPERTKKALDNNAKTIFQARFEANNITCICDVVDRVEENTFDLYEIKSSTKIKPEHYPDLAFQTIVLESAGLKVRNIAVIHVNNQYVRDGEIDPISLSTVTDITNDVRNKIEETKNNIQLAFDVINLPELPDSSPRHAKLGSLNEWMEIYKSLGNKVDMYSIYNLIAPGVKRIGELEDLGISLIKDIPDDFNLTSKQQVQAMATKKNECIINKDKIKDFLNTLIYPLYFLDYETAMNFAPLYNGSKPYQQIPFQYSLHIIEKTGEEPRHAEYLHRDNSHPVPSLLNKLKQDIGAVGSVIVWYKSFETKRNEEMAQMFPEFSKFLEDVNNRTVDLMKPFGNGWFVDKDFLGRASIKYVLPVVVPNLSYKELDIQEGASAQRLWMDTIIREKGNSNKEKLFSDLVKYCEMDTIAMVEIWKVLENL
ncbi:MAG: DUF2779 domain-containing protein [Patescibacteria group bacterium]|nr:DUF2779 domain-containing protein [Patescibacteria group bacterium]